VGIELISTIQHQYPAGRNNMHDDEPSTVKTYSKFEELIRHISLPQIGEQKDAPIERTNYLPKPNNGFKTA
jgi:hypothetical protein